MDPALRPGAVLAFRPVRTASWLAAAPLLLLARPVTGQLPPEAPRLAPAERPAPATAVAPGTASALPRSARAPARETVVVAEVEDAAGALGVFGASLVVPGAGQWMLERRRSYLYLGFELLAWAAYLDRRSGAVRLRDRYRDLARQVARRGDHLSDADASFAYYEAMARFAASGAWDADPHRAGLQPESDPETHNGFVWARARRIHLAGAGSEAPPAAHERALAHYREHAYPGKMAWDWRHDPGAAERYRDLLDESDERFRTATLALGAVVANHLLSAVDGYLSVRLRSPGTRAERPAPSPLALREVDRWTLEIRLPTRVR